jgi:hypothetical protein
VPKDCARPAAQEGNLIKKSKGANAETWTFGYDNLNHCAGPAIFVRTFVHQFLAEIQDSSGGGCRILKASANDEQGGRGEGKD